MERGINLTVNGRVFFINNEYYYSDNLYYPDLPYIESLDSAHLELLRVRRERLSKQFFVTMCKSDSKLNYLLEKRNPSTHNTRIPPTYHYPIPKNERYKCNFVIPNLLDLM